MDTQSLADLTPDFHGRVQRAHRVLGDQGDRLTSLALHLLLGQRRKVDAFEFHRARGDVAVAGQQAHYGQAGRRLSAARFTHEADALAGVDID